MLRHHRRRGGAGHAAAALRARGRQSYNSITVDGDTSTNDTRDRARQRRLRRRAIDERPEHELFRRGAAAVGARARQDDRARRRGRHQADRDPGRGRASDDEAKRAAFTIANSPLVKTAFYGCQPNWGRILAAAGRAGVAMTEAKSGVWFNDVRVVRDGLAVGSLERGRRRDRGEGDHREDPPRDRQRHRAGVDVGPHRGVHPHQRELHEVSGTSHGIVGEPRRDRGLPRARCATSPSGGASASSSSSAAGRSSRPTPATVEDLVLLQQSGLRPVLVHGGGPEITRELERLGKRAALRRRPARHRRANHGGGREGARGPVNKRLVTMIRRAGGRAVGVSGKDACLLKARPHERASELGFVGEVDSIEPRSSRCCSTQVPSGGCFGRLGPDGETYNLNADTVAAALAVAMRRRQAHRPDRRRRHLPRDRRRPRAPPELSPDEARAARPHRRRVARHDPQGHRGRSPPSNAACPPRTSSTPPRRTACWSSSSPVRDRNHDPPGAPEPLALASPE